MPSFCAVFGCSNRHDREKGKSYFRLPKVIKHQGDRTQQLSETRREQWISNIGRADIKPSSYDNIRICSDHFIKKPADLYDKLNPDWAPTVNMGRKYVLLTPSPSKSNARYNRTLNRSTKKQTSAAASALLELSLSTPEVPDIPDNETGYASQTDIDRTLMSAMESELQRRQMENDLLRKKVESQMFDVPFFEDDDSRMKYYTGLTNFSVLKALYNYVEPDISCTHKNVLNKFQQLVLVLMKLRLNCSNQDLAVRFAIII